MAELDDPSAAEPPPYRDPVGLHGVHLLTCRSIWYEPAKQEAGVGIAGIYIHVEPPDGFQFPFRLDRVFVYFQLFGDVGEYRVRIRLVRLLAGDAGDLEEIQLGIDGSPREFEMPTPRPAEISGLNYLDFFTFPIGPVPFREPGLYEYQLWADGFEEPIAREWVLARR